MACGAKSMGAGLRLLGVSAAQREDMLRRAKDTKLASLQPCSECERRVSRASQVEYLLLSASNSAGVTRDAGLNDAVPCAKASEPMVDVMQGVGLN